jgi:hypothetical protein
VPRSSRGTSSSCVTWLPLWLCESARYGLGDYSHLTTSHVNRLDFIPWDFNQGRKSTEHSGLTSLPSVYSWQRLLSAACFLICFSNLYLLKLPLIHGSFLSRMTPPFPQSRECARSRENSVGIATAWKNCVRIPACEINLSSMQFITHAQPSIHCVLGVRIPD